LVGAVAEDMDFQGCAQDYLSDEQQEVMAWSDDEGPSPPGGVNDAGGTSGRRPQELSVCVMQQNSPKIVVSARPGMATSAEGEDPAYIVTTDLTTDLDGYGFSLMRFRGEDVIELMVEDQTNCPLGKSQLSARLFRDRLVVAVAEDAVADLGIPTHYIISFSADADDERLRAMDATLQVICAGIAWYSRQF
jgi:hypothetical protein